MIGDLSTTQAPWNKLRRLYASVQLNADSPYANAARTVAAIIVWRPLNWAVSFAPNLSLSEFQCFGVFATNIAESYMCPTHKEEQKLKIPKKKRAVNSESTEVNPLLAPLILEQGMLKAAFGRKKESHEFQTIENEMLPILKEEGWEVHKEGVRRTRIKKLKESHAQLEDQVWCLLRRLGYPELSADNFKIQYVDGSGSNSKKDISVFAKDDETVIVAICRSREIRGRKTLQRDLVDLESIQKSLATSIRKHYGLSFRPKIIWMCITKNIIWSEQDIKSANAANVRVVTENELQYFDAFAKHMGPAGRFQFLAEFLEGQEIHELAGVKVPATKGSLGNHIFYSFVTTPRHLLKVAFINHQALNHPTGRPTYQRMISPNRIKEIGEFIRKGGYFPTNLLVNFTERCQFDLLPNKENSHAAIKFGWLHLPHKYKSAWVIDGQHRLYGYSHLEDRFLDQSIAVIAFEKKNGNNT